jgi:hypothetical protein
MVVNLRRYPVEKTAAAAQVKDKVQVDRCLDMSVRRPFREHRVEIHLEIVVKRDNIPMATGYEFQSCDLIPDLHRYQR